MAKIQFFFRNRQFLAQGHILEADWSETLAKKLLVKVCLLQKISCQD